MYHLYDDISPWNQPQKKQTPPQLNQPQPSDHNQNHKQNIIHSEIELRRQSLPSISYSFDAVKSLQKNKISKRSKQAKLSPLKILKNNIIQYEFNQQKLKKQLASYRQSHTQMSNEVKKYDIPSVTDSMLKLSKLNILQTKLSLQKNLSVPMVNKLTLSPSKQQKPPQVAPKKEMFISKSQLFKNKMMKSKMPTCKNIMFDYKQQFVSLKMHDNNQNKRRTHILDILLGDRL